MTSRIAHPENFPTRRAWLSAQHGRFRSLVSRARTGDTDAAREALFDLALLRRVPELSSLTQFEPELIGHCI